MNLQDQLLQYLVTGLTNGAIYALIALGLVAIHNVTGVINFSQGESAMLGALIMVSLRNSTELPLVVAFLIAVIIVASIGAMLHLFALKPAKSASSITLIIITIGASIVLRGIALIIWGTDSYALPAFPGGLSVQLGSAVLRPQGIWVFIVTLISVGLLYIFFQHTNSGRALRACAANQLAAQLIGINHQRMATLSFTLGAALGAIAGVVIAPLTYATYDMGTMLGLKGFVAAILGGFSSSFGAVIGGLFLGILEAAGAGFISSGAKNAIAFAVLLIILYWRPTGLLERT